MDNSLALQLTLSLNELLSEKLLVADIGIKFDEIAEKIRSEKVRVSLQMENYRQFEIEMYFALERKNLASLSDFTEADRLRLRIKTLLTEKQEQDIILSNNKVGYFFYENGVIQGKLGRSRSERIVAQLLKGYGLLGT